MKKREKKERERLKQRRETETEADIQAGRMSQLGSIQIKLIQEANWPDTQACLCCMNLLHESRTFWSMLLNVDHI